MIYTVTLNPALDYTMKVSDFACGRINRAESEEITCGGKGINVSYVLNTLGVKSVATGFVAGFAGREIENKLTEARIEHDFVTVRNGCTRINVKIRSCSETDINGKGPQIENDDVEKLISKLVHLTKDDFLVLAGSVPGGVDKDIYARIAERLSQSGVKLVADTTGELLIKILPFKPFLIKPNTDELGELFGTEILTVDDVVFYADKLKDLGAVNVLVSMAEKGSVLLDENGKVHIRDCAKGTLVNSVGAGDSMVAGFIAGYLENHDYEWAHTLGSAAGSATAFSEGLADKESIVTLC